VGGVTVVGQPNLMTSQEFDNFCVNGVFFLARGSPSHTLHHFYRSHLVQDNSLRCPPPPPALPFSCKNTFLFSFSAPCSAGDDSDEYGPPPVVAPPPGNGGRQRPAYNPD
jgi:hypothetical protein